MITFVNQFLNCTAEKLDNPEYRKADVHHVIGKYYEHTKSSWTNSLFVTHVPQAIIVIFEFKHNNNFMLTIDHMEYVRDLIGIDHIGIGSDFDGTSK